MGTFGCLDDFIGSGLEPFCLRRPCLSGDGQELQHAWRQSRRGVGGLRCDINHSALALNKIQLPAGMKRSHERDSRLQTKSEEDGPKTCRGQEEPAESEACTPGNTPLVYCTDQPIPTRYEDFSHEKAR
ncbi:hypothetical protein CSUI_000798 [Cystoisospora suis]|uniref:Uncharacterized protein n=1 Tax=Cystoisospora suis TaxID=483139 RepID=A0A2C6LCL3_9APIC|nr:hypothetical protein CSUI_000798 [Cystoisospora suis]